MPIRFPNFTDFGANLAFSLGEKKFLYISLFPHRTDEPPWPLSSLNSEMYYNTERHINSSSCSDMSQAGIKRCLKVLEAPWESVQASNCGGGVFVKDLLLSHNPMSKSKRVTGITKALRTAWYWLRKESRRTPEGSAHHHNGKGGNLIHRRSTPTCSPKFTKGGSPEAFVMLSLIPSSLAHSHGSSHLLNTCSDLHEPPPPTLKN